MVSYSSARLSSVSPGSTRIETQPDGGGQLSGGVGDIVNVFVGVRVGGSGVSDGVQLGSLVCVLVG